MIRILVDGVEVWCCPADVPKGHPFATPEGRAAAAAADLACTPAGHADLERKAADAAAALQDPKVAAKLAAVRAAVAPDVADLMRQDGAVSVLIATGVALKSGLSIADARAVVRADGDAREMAHVVEHLRPVCDAHERAAAAILRGEHTEVVDRL